MTQLLRNATDVVGVAKNSITLQNLHQLILDAPTSHSQAQSEEWAERSYLITCFEKAEI